ncbi:cysteine protease StiP family protein [Bacillus sp. Marseille-P3661]|uniref:cysteine protease StiP family protein n=1 Tax=Bacillus sp. Marseille-P3661 TaxID=1936234 RepID=UPI000C855EE3|nr:cysteine protease StiP family protein [Bacillus sp. Marseille-P3661]
MSNTLIKMGSYAEQDVIFLLKNLSNLPIEIDTFEREKAIQNGVHYSEMLPIEYKPTNAYMKLFFDSLEENKAKVALAVGIVAEQIVESRGFQTILCSLARGGTPIGILIKRYIELKYNRSLPHYSISIIRGRGIDENAVKFMLRSHPKASITFIDGWTGKGAISKELQLAIGAFNEKYRTNLSSELAVLADPGYCSTVFGTREDFLIPSACLNSTVSGLVSRTVLNSKWIGVDDFHGAKYYQELANEDVSNFYVDMITEQFSKMLQLIPLKLAEQKAAYTLPNWYGLQSIKKIQHEFGLNNINLIKPGVGETTRVLLRRVPWKILVHPNAASNLEHILMLAEERGVQIVKYANMSYGCCGLIKPMESDR